MTAVLLALAAGVAATTITKSKAFASLRNAAKRKSALVGYLVSCPYCSSHWLVFALQVAYQARLVRSGAPALDVIVSCFPMIGLAVLVPAVLTRLYWPRHQSWRIKSVDHAAQTITVEDTRFLAPGQIVDLFQ